MLVPVLLVSLFAALVAPGPDLVLITGKDPGEGVTERTAARLFLKEKLFWKDGSRIVPVKKEGKLQHREF